MDGWSLLAKVRALEVDQAIPPIPAIAITGFDAEVVEQERQTQAFSPGFQKYLFKPVELPHLVAAVAQVSGLQED